MKQVLIQTPLDYIGEIFKVERYNTESLSSYVDRVKSLYNGAFGPNASYYGMVWSALVDIGLPLVPYAEISTTVPSSFIEITPTGITLENGTESLAFGFFTINPSGELLPVSGFTSIVTGINASSTFDISQDVAFVNINAPQFTTQRFGNSETFDLMPFNLLYGSNKKITEIIELNAERDFIQLEKYPIVSGTVSFDNMDSAYQTEKQVEVDIKEYGDYYIDYANGTIKCHSKNEFDIPVYIKYVYYESPFKLFLTPIQIISWDDAHIDYILYNLFGQASAMKRITLPLAESLIDELREENVSYK